MNAPKIYFLNKCPLFNTKLLAVVPMLYIRALDLFILPNPQLWQPPFYSLVLCIQFSLIPHSNEISEFFFLPCLVFKLSILSSSLIHVVAKGKISSFLRLNNISLLLSESLFKGKVWWEEAGCNFYECKRRARLTNLPECLLAF